MFMLFFPFLTFFLEKIKGRDFVLIDPLVLDYARFALLLNEPEKVCFTFYFIK